jgi:hypothetical protein
MGKGSLLKLKPPWGGPAIAVIASEKLTPA